MALRNAAIVALALVGATASNGQALQPLWRSFVEESESNFGDIAPAAFSADGKVHASCTRLGTVVVRDGGSLIGLRTVNAHTAPVKALDLSPDGRLVASSSRNGDVVLSDTQTGQHWPVWLSPSGLFEVYPPGGWAQALRFSADGRLLAAIMGRGRVFLYDVERGALVTAYLSPYPFVYAAAFSSDLSRFVASDGNTRLQIRDTRTGALVADVQATATGTVSLDFDRSGKHVVACNASQRAATVVDSAGHETGRVTNLSAKRCMFGVDATRLVVLDSGSVSLVDVASGSVIDRLVARSGIGSFGVSVPADRVSASFLPGTGPETLLPQCTVWRLSDASVVGTLGFDGQGPVFAYTLDGRRLVEATTDRAPVMRSAGSGAIVSTFALAPLRTPIEVAVSPDSALTAFGEPGRVQIARNDNGQVVWSLAGDVRSPQFTRDSERLYLVRDGRLVQLLRSEGWREETVHPGPFMRVVTSPYTDRFVVSSSSALWLGDSTTNLLVPVRSGQDVEVFCMSRTGQYALVWESGQTLVVSLPSGLAVAAIGQPQRAEVWPAAALARDGDFLVGLNDLGTGRRALAVFRIATLSTTVVEQGDYTSTFPDNLAVHPSGKSFAHGSINGMRGESSGVE